jgi:hypothetical protein
LVGSNVEKLLQDPCVRDVLGAVKIIESSQPEAFYTALQRYVDSMEFWPLIKVVRIYTKADVLSTGAVLVDLPGVHDSNTARTAVTERYMKDCTGEFPC